MGFLHIPLSSARHLFHLELHQTSYFQQDSNLGPHLYTLRSSHSARQAACVLSLCKLVEPGINVHHGHWSILLHIKLECESFD